MGNLVAEQARVSVDGALAQAPIGNVLLFRALSTYREYWQDETCPGACITQMKTIYLKGHVAQLSPCRPP